MLTGGGAMHLNDSFGHTAGLAYTCNHHEQACAIAAEGYARVANRPAVVNVTTGPGGINALNGVFGAYVDSIPMIVVSGQVKREMMTTSYQVAGLRQLGDQEANIIALARPICKYAHCITDPASARYHVERAFHLAVCGRPGPVWLDVPIDVQAASIQPDALPGYDPQEDHPGYELAALPLICERLIERLEHSERPVLLLGKGVRLAGALETFRRVAERLQIPVALAWTCIDGLPTDHPLYCGRPGDLGDRPGNFTVQNSDLLIAIGCRLGIRQVSYNHESFARHAFKVMIDADRAELHKPFPRIDLPIHCDARLFLEELARQLEHRSYQAGRHAGWLEWCRRRVERYPVVQPRHRRVTGGRLNPYYFIERLFDLLADDDVVVCGDGTANVVTFQAARIRRAMRLFCNTGNASMGYDLPAALGAAVARQGGRVICLAGDGSLQLNIQELQTLAHHRWPVKLFVLNNDGYLSMRMSQGAWFKRFVGEGPHSGVSFPDTVRLAAAYGLPACQASGESFEEALRETLACPGPAVCDVLLDAEQPFEPKTASRQLPDGRMVSAPLEDQFPFLPRDELASNLLVPPMEF